jgi:hypothetical protein
MSNDLLARATRALREATDPSDAGMTEGLARLRWSRATRPRSLGRRLPATIGFAAVLLGGAVAWAGTSGRLQRWVDHLVGPIAPSTPLEHAVTGSGTSTPTRPAISGHPDPSTESSPAEPAGPLRVEAPADVQSAPPSPARRQRLGRSPAPPPQAPALGSESADVQTGADPDAHADALFRTANSIHFSGSDPHGALRAWDAYLEAAPAGHRWLPEARFNRAVTLVALDRREEARQALAPFARGTYGSYRRDEARALLERASVPAGETPSMEE